MGEPVPSVQCVAARRTRQRNARRRLCGVDALGWSHQADSGEMPPFRNRCALNERIAAAPSVRSW